MRVLVTGAEGQLGRAVLRALRRHDARGAGRTQLDVTDASSVDEAVRNFAPAAVVHCAALTDTSLCERDPELAERVNADGTEIVARASASEGARLVAVSTNEVYAGQDDDYVESSPAGPLNAYGRSKVLGEERAFSAHGDTLTIRTSWLYGDGSTFPAKVLAAARDGRPLRFVTDEVASPTLCDDLARAIVLLIESVAPAGVYHLTNVGAASRYDWAAAVLDLAGINRSIERVTTKELRAAGYDGPVKPARTVLRNTRAAALGVTMRPWRAALEDWWQTTEVVARD